MSQQGIYNESKMIWWYARDHGLPRAPKQVQLILSDLCNQDCSFCAYRMSGYTSNQLFMAGSEAAAYGHSNPKRWIPTERAMRLLDEFVEAGVLSVQFTGGGEPTVHPDHEKLFTRALALGLRCSLVSNGVKWSERLIFNVLPKFDWVRVSIDAGDAESYATTRRTPAAHWDRVWEHVQYLATAIREQATPCALGLGFVVTPDSFEQIPAFAARAAESGAANLRFTAMFSTEDDAPFRSIYNRVRGLIAEARAKHEGLGFTVHDNFGSRFDDLKQHAPDYPTCGYQYYTTYVGGDLHAYRCCVLAYNERGRIAGGDLRERSFAEFWASQQRRDDLAALDPRGCERCQFNFKNRQLLYVMGNTESDVTPRHLEWP
jgi:MoaA/NifB/PqqE/SkfB family radical SAM enzyme